MKNETKYHRGNGECVVPEDRNYECLFLYETICPKCRIHLASLPASKTYVCDPAEPIGWLQGYEERYEVYNGYWTNDEWISVSKERYDATNPSNRRIFLVPADKGDEKDDGCLAAARDKYPIDESYTKQGEDLQYERRKAFWQGYVWYKNKISNPLPNNSADQQERWVNVYKDDNGRFISNEDYGSCFDAYESRDELKTYVGTYRLSRNVPQKDEREDFVTGDNATINTCGDAPLTCSNPDEQDLVGHDAMCELFPVTEREERLVVGALMSGFQYGHGEKYPEPFIDRMARGEFTELCKTWKVYKPQPTKD